MQIIKNQIRDIKLGKNVKIHEPVNLYECEFSDNVKIGPFVEIQKNVIIGKNTTISSHSFVCELVTIGENCFISHGVMFTNDLFKNGKLGGSKEKWKPTKIGNNELIGRNSTILPIEICDDVVIGAGSVVTKNIQKSGIYFGSPANS